MKIKSIFIACSLGLSTYCSAFQGSYPAFSSVKRLELTRDKEVNANSGSALHFFSFDKNRGNVVEEIIPEEDETWTDFGKSPISFVYAGFWVLLVSFTAFFAPGEFNSPVDNAMLASIIENPASPDMNPIYYGIFNVFAIIPIVLGCTISPRASEKGIPTGPPLFLSTFIAYFVMGPYLALRKEPKKVITNPSEELGWITRNIWENKIFNYATVAFGLLCLLSGFSGVKDLSTDWNGCLELIQTSKFASVSMVDLTCITLLLTKEVADDYKVRCSPENIDKAAAIGVSTALLPILGAAIYCAVRPSFDEEK